MFGPMLESVWNLVRELWWAIALIILIKIGHSANFKGHVGEFIINLKAKIFLPKSKYRLFKNVVLPAEEGTTQIDHVIVSCYGVFVVETKNMKGWIFGGERQKSWTQKIYRYSKKFQNPLHQNYKHTKTLQKLLKLDENQIHSVVVFIGDSKFKTEMPDNVTHGNGYIRYILAKNDKVLTDEAKDRICRQLCSKRLRPSLATDRQHVANLKRIHSPKIRQTNDQCPKCGGALVQRKTKRGPNAGNQFLGCSNFPKCRYTAKISAAL